MPAGTDRTIGVVGTVARAIIGVVFLVIAFRLGMGWANLIGAFLVLPGIALASAIVLNHALAGSALRARGRMPWSAVQILAAALVILTVIAVGVGLTFVTPMNGAGSIVAFFGASMLVASAAGYQGCEVLALPNVLLGRRDAIWCPLYTPLDQVESARSTRACRPE